MTVRKRKTSLFLWSTCPTPRKITHFWQHLLVRTLNIIGCFLCSLSTFKFIILLFRKIMIANSLKATRDDKWESKQNGGTETIIYIKLLSVVSRKMKREGCFIGLTQGVSNITLFFHIYFTLKLNNSIIELNLF